MNTTTTLLEAAESAADSLYEATDSRPEVLAHYVDGEVEFVEFDHAGYLDYRSAKLLETADDVNEWLARTLEAIREDHANAEADRHEASIYY